MKRKNWRRAIFWFTGIQLCCTGLLRAEALQIPTDTKTLLQGHASSEQQSYFEILFKAGKKALHERQFAAAQQKLIPAADELRKHNISDDRYAQVRTALGWSYLGLDKAPIAQKYFEEGASRSQSDRTTQASALTGLAETQVLLGNAKKAATTARKAIQVNESLKPNENVRELARAYMVLGRASGALGMDDEAAAAFKKAIQILDGAVSESLELDLADVLRETANEYARQEKISESKDYASRMYDILDRSVKFDKTPAQSGTIPVHWSDGGLRSRQIYDPDYPLKYVWVDGIRVAATLVRSENVVGALICLSNCNRTRRDLALGRVELNELAPRFNHPLDYVEPIKLDMALEEQHISALTWRRPWLNHIEKTRRIPGYLRDGVLDTDNFFGNNMFGAYGNWGSIAETKTPLLTREQYLYGLSGHKKVGDLASFLSKNQGGQTSTYLDAGDSKTGLVFFRFERFEKAKLRIPIGNLVIEIPFNSCGPR